MTMNMIISQCLVLLFTTIYQSNAEEVVDKPFALSAYALEKYFLANLESITYPEEPSCNKIFKKLYHYHTNYDDIEPCSMYRSPAAFGLSILFSKFSKNNGIKVDLEVCTCHITPKHDNNLQEERFCFSLAAFNKQGYFILYPDHQLDEMVHLSDYIQTINSEDRVDTASVNEIFKEQYISNIKMDFESLEKNFIKTYYDIAQGNLLNKSWLEISSVKDCLEFYQSFRKSYYLEKEKDETVHPICHLIKLPANAYYSITFSHFVYQDPVLVPITFCDCHISITNFITSKTYAVDESTFYLAKVATPKKKLYYLLKDNNNENDEDDVEDFNLHCIGYYEVEDGKAPTYSEPKDLFKVKLPYKNNDEIRSHLSKTYKDLMSDWEDDDKHIANCLKLYSTAKYTNLNLDLNSEKYCKVTDESYFAKISGKRQLLYLVLCDCWHSINSDLIDAHKFQHSLFYYVKLRNSEKYFIFKKDIPIFESYVIPKNYIEFV